MAILSQRCVMAAEFFFYHNCGANAPVWVHCQTSVLYFGVSDGSLSGLKMIVIGGCNFISALQVSGLRSSDFGLFIIPKNKD